ncbi:hypothetical protein B0H17DRAFT_398336 [Mycena rosella]|uniref:DUF7587 domain-containing protein n=1 Tax=Mycena rosella TaxID=1033263 RepID=A0AAD7GII0_MYCRO|nr:hypothetical protein B0H17DRAFT_398336 [Mycena rosella]
MSSSHMLPPFRFGTNDKYRSLTLNPANRFIFRVHRAAGRGALTPAGFFSYGQSTPNGDYDHFTGSLDALAATASAHITQWKDKTAPLRSPFISASFSVAYVLFEAHRWNAHHGCTDTQISIIDTAQITSDAWLATELVGAYWTDAAFFARWAEEVLVYHHIPIGAIVATLPLSSFLDFLPRWCDDIVPHIRSRQLRSTEKVAYALASAAANPANDTDGDLVPRQYVQGSIQVLRHTLPASMVIFDPHTHADAVDAIARLAAVFVWWPKWITGVNPAAYPAVLERARNVVLLQLEVDKLDATESLFSELEVLMRRLVI